MHDLRVLTGRGAFPLKNWLLEFWGGRQNGGVDVSLKLRGFWAPDSAGLIATDAPWEPLLMAGLKCSHWNESSPAVNGSQSTGSSLDWARDDGYRQPVSAKRILNEVIAYHVDKMLGLQTIPYGKLVAISTTTWAKWFSTFFCVDSKTHMSMLRRRVDAKHSPERMIIIGWMQQMISPLVAGPQPLRELECGKLEPNGTDVGGGPHFLDSYYEALLVGAITFRGDVRSNCFAALADADTVEGCERSLAQHQSRLLSRSLRHSKGKREWSNNLRVINLDNDKPCTFRSEHHVVWHRPCNVPQYLRARVLGINNFSTTLLESVRLNEPLLRKVDLDVIQERYLKVAEPYFMRLADQFRKCEP